jgi:hypothetical protein
MAAENVENCRKLAAGDNEMKRRRLIMAAAISWLAALSWRLSGCSWPMAAGAGGVTAWLNGSALAAGAVWISVMASNPCVS